MKIRKYQKEDWLFLMDFEYWSNGVCLGMQTPDETTLCYVAEVDECIAGYICGENTKLYGNILIATEVRTEYRKQGIFTALYNEYIKHSNKAITVFHNEDLSEFYKKCGFVIGTNLRVSMTEVHNG